MAEVNTDDELDRGAAADVGPHDGGGAQGAGVALADEGIDELPVLIALAVGAALLIVGFLWPNLQDTVADDDDKVAVVADGGDAEEAAPEPEEAAEPAPEETAEPVALPDVPAIQALVDASGAEAVVSADGNIVFLEGTVPDEDTRNALIETAGAQANVDAVDATGLTIVAPPAPEGAVIDATASQVSLVLEGTVPDEATRDAVVARAVAVYSEAQVEDRLVIDENVAPPAVINLSGSMTDPVLYDQVSSAFDGIDGVELGDVLGFTLAESTDLEAALNSLEPIQFASGSAQIDAASSSILDEAADLLNANADVVLEIGGHTDSVGGEGPNQVLSEARANAVLAALRDRGVQNDLTPVGFGERRLKVSPDEGDPAAQAENRRIEFRITG
jgi:OOP family OmpA-OmpF porin